MDDIKIIIRGFTEDFQAFVIAALERNEHANFPDPISFLIWAMDSFTERFR